MLVTFQAVKGETIGHSYKGKSVVLVNDNTGKTVAMLVKARNTKTDIHPWKVFTTGTGSTMLAVFFEDKDAAQMGKAFDYEHDKIGGKVAAKTFIKRYFLNR